MQVIAGFFKKLISTIYNLKFYRGISKEDTTKGIIFILAFDFLVVILFFIIIAIIFFPKLPTLESYITNYIEEKLPVMIFENGELSSKVKQPYVFLEIEDFAIVLDTTGKTADIPEKYNYGVLITKNKIRMKKEKYKYEEYHFKDIKKDLVIDKAFAKDITRKAIKIIKIAYFPFVLLILPFILGIFLLAQLIIALYISVLGLIVNIFTKVDLDFGGLYNISLYLLVPITIISLFTMSLPFKITIISLIYLYLILNSFKAEQPA